jgi:hypothetical protein
VGAQRSCSLVLSNTQVKRFHSSSLPTAVSATFADASRSADVLPSLLSVTVQD